MHRTMDMLTACPILMIFLASEKNIDRVLEVVSKVARGRGEINFKRTVFCAGTFCSTGVEGLGCQTLHCSTIPSGKTSNRSCRAREPLADPELMTDWFWKASCGSCAAERVGAICRNDIPVPAPAGDGYATGKRKMSGSTSGDSFSRNWTPRGGSTGMRFSWTAASLRPKKGALRG